MDYFDIGDVTLNRTVYSDLANASDDLIADLTYTIVHETGHALGLKHPHDDGLSGRPTFADFGLEPFDDVLFTVMSYENTGEIC